jgi:polyisoprenoid-binding protein YceI
MSAHHRILSLALLALGIGLQAQAKQKAAPTTSYQLDASAGKVFIKVGTATRIGHEHGVQGDLKSGKIVLGGEGEMVFDMASLTADTDEARKRVGLEEKKVSENEANKVTATMRGKDVLDVESYPTATFKISTAKPLDKQAAGEPGEYQLDGHFTLRGKEQPLQIRAKVEKTDKEGVLRMTGSFPLRQTEYGIKPYSAAGGLAKVADELQIMGDLVLTPAASK